MTCESDLQCHFSFTCRDRKAIKARRAAIREVKRMRREERERKAKLLVGSVSTTSNNSINIPHVIVEEVVSSDPQLVVEATVHSDAEQNKNQVIPNGTGLLVPAEDLVSLVEYDSKPGRQWQEASEVSNITDTNGIDLDAQVNEYTGGRITPEDYMINKPEMVSQGVQTSLGSSSRTPSSMSNTSDSNRAYSPSMESVSENKSYSLSLESADLSGPNLEHVEHVENEVSNVDLIEDADDVITQSFHDSLSGVLSDGSSQESGDDSNKYMVITDGKNNRLLEEAIVEMGELDNDSLTGQEVTPPILSNNAKINSEQTGSVNSSMSGVPLHGSLQNSSLASVPSGLVENGHVLNGQKRTVSNGHMHSGIPNGSIRSLHSMQSVNGSIKSLQHHQIRKKPVLKHRHTYEEAVFNKWRQKAKLLFQSQQSRSEEAMSIIPQTVKSTHDINGVDNATYNVTTLEEW